jgi:acetaldehyde dehydrogenase/alcohol dehydrogenase
MLPHVIAYNAAVPTKFMPSPNQRAYVAHKKYALMADLLGLGGTTVDEKVAKLIASVQELMAQLKFPRSIAEVGISKEDFEKALPELVKNAFDDPSWRSNPRMPLMTELAELFWTAYFGHAVSKDDAAALHATAAGQK